MSFNGSGTFLINSTGQPVVANTVISATVFNALTADLATGLTNCITKDGQSTPTANIPMGSNKITGLANGTLASDAANLGQVQTTAAKLIGSIAGVDTITGIMSPTLTAYAAGQLFYFIASGANTGAVTLNIDGLGAKAVTRDGATALAAGDINSGEIVVVIYDGTRFQMINAANSFGNTTINGTLTVTGNTTLGANVSIASALAVGGKADLPNVSAALMVAAVGIITDLRASGASISSANAGTAIINSLQATGASVASMNANVALLTTATVTNLQATGASIASANIANLSLAGVSVASANFGVAVVTDLRAIGASVTSANVGTAVITTGTVTNLTVSGASIASANIGNLQFTAASIASINAGVAVVTNLTATGASIASANVGTALVTRLDVTGASAASMNANVALLTTATVTNLTATSASIASANVGTIALTRLDVDAASVASANAAVANVTDLRVAGASVTSANIGTALVTRLDVTGASAASMNANVALITTGTVTNLTSTAASIASANVGTAVITTGTVTNLTATSASVASANAGTAVVTNLTATGASIASANVGTGVVTTLTATQASVGSINAAVALVTDGTVTTLSGTQASITSINHSVVRLLGSSSGYVGLQGAAAAGSTTYTLPSADGSNGQVLTTNGSGTLSWTTAGGGGGTGDVVGPASATDNAITRFDQTTGKLIQNSTVILDDAGTITGVASLAAVTASITSANVGTAVITTLTATGASVASANVGTAVITRETVTAASIASANVGVAVITTLTATQASVASINAAVALVTTGTVTNLTSTAASIASANIGVAAIGTLSFTAASIASLNAGTAVITSLTATGASIASANAGVAVLALGAAGTPSYTFTSDLNTGMWSPAADTVAWSTGGSERIRVTSGGNVGINTTAPGDSKLRVQNSSGIFGNANPIQSWAYANFQVVNLHADGSLNPVFNTDAESNWNPPATMIWQFRGTEQLRINSGGEVIVGITDQGAYNLQCNGTGVWGAGAYTNGSDARLKDNIQSLDSGLDVVKAMRPVTFQYKPEYSKDQSVQPGFIAQELQTAMAGKPYLEGVVQEGTNHLNVAYQNIIPILVKAIQELEAKVAALEAK